MSETKYDIVVIHGTKGSPEINWFPWIKSLLQDKGHSVFIPKMPTPERQSPESWFSALRQQAPVIGKNTILIGHSLGATFLLHILETVKEPVSQAVFVSPVLSELGVEEYDTLNAPFFKKDDFAWSTISKNMKRCLVFHGDNDPYVPQAHAEFVQEKTQGTFFIIPNGGHLNGESGYTTFPQLVEALHV